MIHELPIYLQGKVCKGFGRGSKELGTPTANFGEEVESMLPCRTPSGIYYGWAQVDNSNVYPMVMSIGWNPFYKNIKRTIETHVLHDFHEDFYGSLLKVVILGYIRPEKNFSSREELVNEIKNDISISKEKIKDPAISKYKNHKFFQASFSEEKNLVECLDSTISAKI